MPQEAAVLPPDFYQRPTVVSALASYDFGTLFKSVRRELGLTQEEFGFLIGLAQSRICKIENGLARLRDIESVVRITTVLETPADLLGFATEGMATLEADPKDKEVSWLQRRDFMTAVTATALGAGIEGSVYEQLSALVPAIGVEPSRRVGIADVERIEATTKAFRDWDNRWGGGILLAAVVAQLNQVLASAKKAAVTSESIRRRLLVATADLAHLGAWASYDVERHEEARRLWMVALDVSQEARNLDLVGAVLRGLAHQALHLRRPDEALRLLRLAYATTADPDHQAPELALSEIAAYEAWCHAAAGNRRPCERALGKAEDHFDKAREDDTLPWLGHFDYAELTALRGHAYHVLAGRIPDAASHAEPLLKEAVKQRGPEYARSKTLNLIALSATYFQQGDGIEEGVRIGLEALEGASTLNSPRALYRLRGLDSATRPYQKKPEVADFRHQLHLVL
jgi:transcriptional regulator with XRE-family HTH domain